MQRRIESWMVSGRSPSPLAGAAFAAVAVAICTLVIFPLKTGVDPLSLDVLYIPAILLIAGIWGTRLAIATAVGSLAAFDFFHIPPVHTLSVTSHPEALVVFAVAMLAATLVATLTGRVRVAVERERFIARARERLIAAADEERRRVVRDLHDGAQQRLVHAVIILKLARRELEQGQDGKHLVDEGLEQAEQATAELRELAHGILPSVLTRGGLKAAIESLRSRVCLPVEVDVGPERFPPAIEATAYFVVSEALTNAVKYASATKAELKAKVEDGALCVEVRDDGAGGARLDPAHNPSGGLAGLRDRVDALDGRLQIESPAGRGTRVSAVLPVGSWTSPDQTARLSG